MPHHILARGRGHLEATVVFHDLDIRVHTVQCGFISHPRPDPHLWLCGEQLTGVLRFLICADLLLA